MYTKIELPLCSDLGCLASHILGSRKSNHPVQNSRETRTSDVGQSVNGEYGTSNSEIYLHESLNDVFMAEITSNCGWKSLRSSRIGKAVLRPLGHLGVMVLASPFIQANENQSTFAQDLL